MKGYLWIFIVVLFVSCNQEKENNPVEYFINISDNEKLHLASLYSDVNYIQLDTSTNVYFSKYNKILVKDKYLFVVEQRDINRVSCFDLNTGICIFEINNFGMGPDEIFYPQTLYPDFHNNCIQIFDSGKRQLFYYDFQGKLIKTQSCPVFFKDFIKRKNGDYIFYAGNIVNIIDGKPIRSSIIITDSVFNIKQHFNEIAPSEENLLFGSNKNIVEYKDILYFINSPDNNLYKIGADTAQTVFSLHLGNRNLPDEMLFNKSNLELADWISKVKNDGFCWGISEYFENDIFSLSMITCLKERSHYYVMYDKALKKHTIHSKENMINDIDNGYFGRIIFLDDESMICLVEAYELIDFLKKENLSAKTREKYLNLTKNGTQSNPVLIKFTK